MANSNAPFGFTPICRIDGAVWNDQTRPYIIDSGYGTAIYRGDPVTLDTNGTIVRATAGTDPILGIFWGCSYTPNPPGIIPESAAWPGSGNNGNGTGYVIVDTNVVFRVQAGSSNIPLTSVGSNVQFNLGTGNTLTGGSGAYVESPANTATLPFRIVSLWYGVGVDTTAAYNQVQVIFNNQSFRTNTGLS